MSVNLVEHIMRMRTSSLGYILPNLAILHIWVQAWCKELSSDIVLQLWCYVAQDSPGSCNSGYKLTRSKAVRILFFSVASCFRLSASLQHTHTHKFTRLSDTVFFILLSALILHWFDVLTCSSWLAREAIDTSGSCLFGYRLLPWGVLSLSFWQVFNLIIPPLF